MTHPSPAAAAAPNNPPDPTTKHLHRYNTRIEFPLKESLSNAPLLLQKLLSKLVGDSPGMLFYTADDIKIDIEDFPKEKKAFDRLFGTTVTEERNQRIVVGFEIRTEIPFRKIKTAAWNFLTANHIFMKKHPGPLSKMDIITLGWMHKAHPTFTSHDNLRTELQSAIAHKLYNLSDTEKESLQVTAPGETADIVVPDIFFSPGRAHGKYEGSDIDSNVLFLQSERSQAKLLRTLLELTFSETTLMEYIPSFFKRDTPELFGKYLCLQNSFLEKHRNVSIVGLSTTAMDHEQVFAPEQEESDSLWNFFMTIPGVLRIDSCRRTPDLGKWNLSTTEEFYPSVTQWFDENLPAIFENIPARIRAESKFEEFPIPRRLSRIPNKTPSPAASKSAYSNLLVSRMSSSPNVPLVQRSAWRPFQPVVDVSYAFNDNEFPPMHQKTSDTKSTASTSHVSSLSEQAIKDAINLETTKLKDASKKYEAAIDIRIQSIESTLNNLATELVSQIYSKLSGPDSPFVTVLQLDEKLDRLSRHIENLVNSTSQPRTIGSPARKQARTASPDQQTYSTQEEQMAIDSQPPESTYE